MGYNRVESKRLARQAIRGVSPHPMLVTLVYVLLTGVLSYVIAYFVSNPFNMAYLYLLDGVYAPEQIYRTIFTPGRVGLFLLMEILLTLYQWVMAFGYTSYALRLARGEGPGFRNLLDGFAVLGRSILVSLLVWLFTVLWSLLGMIPYVLLVMLGVLLNSFFPVVLGIIVLVVWVVVVSYRYRLSLYFALDNPQMGALETLRQSKLAMQGCKRILFVQDLSFLGWEILSIFTLGILGLWVIPYASAADANFYDWMVHGSFTTPGGYESQYGQDPFRKDDLSDY
ncbi:DUF975 family protein [Flavonifractor hominis]|uniref:DUF975 family protein n=1 Tax=Flavonifractor hominis TaxID=3133178 RepID=A0ABV1ET58_9FIRM